MTSNLIYGRSVQFRFQNIWILCTFVSVYKPFLLVKWATITLLIQFYNRRRHCYFSLSHTTHRFVAVFWVYFKMFTTTWIEIKFCLIEFCCLFGVGLHYFMRRFLVYSITLDHIRFDEFDSNAYEKWYYSICNNISFRKYRWVQCALTTNNNNKKTIGYQSRSCISNHTRQVL